MNLEELMASTPPMQQHALIKGFQAGAASRDAYIEQLELALLQVRKAICGDIHNTDDLLDLIASRDAEIAELQKAIDENWVTHQQIVAASKERDQLRDEIAAVVAALEAVIPEVAGGNAGLIAYNKCKEALASTEPK